VVERLPPSIAFRLRGVKSNRDAIGATVTVETELGRQSKTLQAGSGFLSQHSKEVFFGLGAAKGSVKATIRWPSGLVQEIRDLPLNHRVWVEEGAAVPHGAVPSRHAGARRCRSASGRIAAGNGGDLAALAGGRSGVSSFRDPRQAGASAFPRAGSAGRTARELAVPGVQLLSVRVDEAEDLAATYNILYRYLFDRHRDLTLPTSFLIDENGDIVKVYQGPVRRRMSAKTRGAFREPTRSVWQRRCRFAASRDV
jgi:hypothetical protein